MERLSVTDAAEKLGISKEAIYNRIRRKTIESQEIDGVRYVLLNKNLENSIPANTNKQKESRADANFIEYLKSEIEYLKLKNISLQEDKEQLYKEKEELLISSKNEIKNLYHERDEKLKYFLSLLERPLTQNRDRVETIEVKTTEESKVPDKKWLFLKDFLDTLDLRKKQRKEIKKLIIKEAYDNESIKIEAGMVYIEQNFDIASLKKDSDE
ncbi:MAG: hypothetical protein GXZ15_01425 [Campylobacter sp.]|nr:hypothetical protein [Campylobacter sp.]